MSDYLEDVQDLEKALRDVLVYSLPLYSTKLTQEEFYDYLHVKIKDIIKECISELRLIIASHADESRSKGGN